MSIRFYGLLVFFFLCIPFVQAQTSKGTLLIGGNVSGHFLREENLYMADISPTVGLFVEDRLAIGGNIQLGIARYGQGGKYTSLKILPMGRYYFGKRQEMANIFFLQADAGYHRINTIVQDIYIAKSGLGGGVGPGLSFFLNRMVSVEGLVKLSSFWYTEGSSSLQSEFRIGVQLYLIERHQRLF